MNSKKMIMLLMIMWLVLTLSSAAGADYKIPDVNKDIEITDDGSCIITEEITYDLEKSINGTYRDIPRGMNQSITNISVETPGYYNDIQIEETSNNTHIKVWLYKNPEKTQKLSKEKVKVIYRYTFNRGVKVYNDIAEFQYTSWGDEWDSRVNYLRTTIRIPGNSSECEYWNNPDTYITESSFDGNQLVTVAQNIPRKTSLEQRILMPKTYIKSTKNAQVIDMDAKTQIEQDQKKYAQKKANADKIVPIFLSVLALIMILPAGVYLIFGRERKSAYDKGYEYDLPTDSSPVEVNDIVVGDVGKVNFHAFNAVILDLIDRGYLRIVNAHPNNTILRVSNEQAGGLKDYEVDLIGYLQKFVDSQGYIPMAAISEKETPGGYNNFISYWQKKAAASVPSNLEKRYFTNLGVRVFRIISAIMIILGVGITLLGIIAHPIIALIGVIIIIEAVILLKKRNTFFGRWTKEGKEYHDRWMNFKKYISDYSLINERPPESVAVWGKYLVYAAALGCADEATDTMQRYFDIKGVSKDYIADNSVMFFAYHGGYHQMNSSFEVFQAPNSKDSSGSIGSVGGGGFGGGGGGVF